MGYVHRSFRMPRNKRWTVREDRTLVMMWGSSDVRQIAERLDRSPEAVRRRASILGYSSSRRTLISMREAEKLTGYGHLAIKTAMKELGLKLRRRLRISCRVDGPDYPNRDFGISEGQLDRVVEWLTSQPSWRIYGREGKKTVQGMWGVGAKPVACLGCGQTQRPHLAKGFCKPCYGRYWRERLVD